MATHLEEKLPSRFKEIKEFWDFCIGEDPEFDRARGFQNKWLDNRFPQNCDVDGVSIWEEILDVKPTPEDTLEDRRFRVISQMLKRTPYTWAQLNRMMEALCGKDGYELKLGYFTLMVTMAMDSQSKLKSVMQMLREVVPAHILLDINQILNYFLNITVVTYRTNLGEMTILPYQVRETEQAMEAQIAVCATIEKEITIPCQKR